MMANTTGFHISRKAMLCCGLLAIFGIRSTHAIDGQTSQQIVVQANASECARYEWKDRGPAPRGFISGMALVYAKNVCELTGDSPKFSAALAETISPSRSATDALAHYGKDESQPLDRLRILFSLGLGLGMQESSGNPTEGRDLNVKEPTVLNSESGLFQTSYDSYGRSTWFPKLRQRYSSDQTSCLRKEFMDKVKDKELPVFGTGPGADYQLFLKTCPAYAAEYAMLMLRIDRQHFGPINTKKAEIASECTAMFRAVEDVVRPICGK